MNLFSRKLFCHFWAKIAIHKLKINFYFGIFPSKKLISEGKSLVILTLLLTTLTIFMR
jgi:hypothetical protein